MNTFADRQTLGATLRIVSLMVASALGVHEASAENRAPQGGSNVWKSECGACHVAYPPSLLPASAWLRIMSGLDKHFGADASMDAHGAAQISAFLESRAARDGERAAPNSLRITETGWFRSEHGEVPAATWKRAAVKSASNCGACHMLAEQGDFRESNIRIPR